MCVKAKITLAYDPWKGTIFLPFIVVLITYKVSRKLETWAFGGASEKVLDDINEEVGWCDYAICVIDFYLWK